MHRSRFETPGWAAFDRKHREKQGSGAEGAFVPYPIISNETNSGFMESSNNTYSGESSAFIGSVPTRSFSSVLSSKPIDFPPLKAHSKPDTLNINIDGDKHDAIGGSNVNPIWMLKDLHSWADQQLIEDILAAVNNDLGKASILLKEMFSSETETKKEQPGYFGMCSQSNLSEHVDVFLEKSDTFEENKLSNSSKDKLIVEQFHVSAEPEWEEDDVYLSHRKDALKMMRAASQHSRGANNAYLRGDHLTAQQLSARAREEWTTAEQLNAQAAEEILRIRNINNDLWKLDLHGLHATEAVHALKQHLQRIESMMANHSVSPYELTKVEASSSFVSLRGLETSTNAKGIIVPQQRQTLLHVITGTGNHSKGQASLPAAIKSFLIEGGYRFDDARLGVISVRPIFRNR